MSSYKSSNNWHFVTFDNFVTFDISCHLTFCDIWHFVSCEISCHLRYRVIWDFVSFEISCYWDFVSFEILCHLWFCIIRDFVSFEISCHLRFHVIWDFMSFVGEPTFISPASHLNIFQLLWYLQTTWWGDNHPVTKACGRENKEEKKN